MKLRSKSMQHKALPLSGRKPRRHCDGCKIKSQTRTTCLLNSRNLHEYETWKYNTYNGDFRRLKRPQNLLTQRQKLLPQRQNLLTRRYLPRSERKMRTARPVRNNYNNMPPKKLPSRPRSHQRQRIFWKKKQRHPEKPHRLQQRGQQQNHFPQLLL